MLFWKLSFFLKNFPCFLATQFFSNQKNDLLEQCLVRIGGAGNQENVKKRI